ncbi:hypothetical protein [Paraburkholderia bannensis]|uniref:hypothetical protein n=2 Tax=Paraburkholderia bannensis TaxID=765414 RepID=UPI002AC32771|nr:hypothetical protein [Paraburkholderia bannensis]
MVELLYGQWPVTGKRVAGWLNRMEEQGSRSMEDEIRDRIGPVAGQLVRQMLELGLSWEEAVCAFGLAARASAQLAASAGGLDADGCMAMARERFDDAFAQDVRVVVTTVDVNENASGEDSNPLLVTARRRRSGKLH